jgi:hypothetical protein
MIDAMKQALEALEYHQDQTRPIHKTQETIAALRQAIEQAEKESTLQEISDIGQEIEPWDTSDMAHRSGGLAIDDDDIQEYKRPWVGMSDVEIAIYSSGFSGIRLAREIEAQLKERNT